MTLFQLHLLCEYEFEGDEKAVMNRKNLEGAGNGTPEDFSPEFFWRELRKTTKSISQDSW
jgi:hypothetical protein